jgi:hypothetical protein
MIQANQLRIGNLVNFDPNGGVDYCIVKSIISATELRIATADEQLRQIVAYTDSGWLNPIPLTPELLEKCDFKKGEPISKGYYIPYSSNQYSNFIINYCPSNNSFWLDSYVYDVKIEFLHHLQNIYYSLIGQELQVNL